MGDYLGLILHKESDNTNRVYLYREGDYWYAHGNSALHLSFLLPEIRLYNRIHILRRISVASAMLHIQTLGYKINRRLIRKYSDSEIEISIPKEKEKEFIKWKEVEHQRQTE